MNWLEAVGLVIEPEVRHLLHAPLQRRLGQREQEATVCHGVRRKTPHPHPADHPGAAARRQKYLGRHVTKIYGDVNRRVADSWNNKR